MSGYLAVDAPISEFIDWLRAYAISNRVDERFVAKIDELYALQDNEAELEQTGNELTEMEEAADGLAYVLRRLLDALPAEDTVHDPHKQAAMEREAREALEEYAAREAK